MKLDSTTPYYHNGASGAQGTADNTAAGANATFDASTATLTLNGVNITTSHEWTAYSAAYKAGIYADDDLTIKLAGTNTVKGDDAGNGGNSFGIYVRNILIIEDDASVEGDGKLTATSANNASQSSSGGIRADKKITINSGDITAEGAAAVFSTGISGMQSTTISGGTVKATGGTVTGANSSSCGIGGNAIITGGTVIAETTSASEAGNRAFDFSPTLTGYTGGYQWNTNESSPSWTQSTVTAFGNVGYPTYVQIKPALVFADSASYDVPAGTAGTAITAIDVSLGVSGGKLPYTFSLENAPTWLSIGSSTGKITGTCPASAQAAATATIKVTDSDTPANSKTIEIAVGAVTVAPPTEYGITPDAGSSWTKGGTSGLGFTANAEHSKFTGVSVDGTAIGADKYTDAPGSTKVTLLPAYLETISVGTHTLRVNFTDGYAETSFTIADTPAATHTITASTGAHGSISPSGAVTVTDGEDKTFTFTPERGYKVASVTVDGLPIVGFGTSWTFSDVTDDHTISVTFALSNPVIPAMGDSSTPGLWIGIMLLAGAGIAASVVLAKRKRKA